MKKLLLGLLSCFVSVALMAEGSVPQKVVTEQHTINDVNRSYSISLIDENAANLVIKGMERYENYYWKRFWTGIAIAVGVPLVVVCTAIIAATH